MYTFFEASRFECCKTNFDAKKVTYNKYTCVISGMSREIIKINGRDSAECQNWEKKGCNGHYGICLSHNKTKLSIVLLLLHFKEQKNVNLAGRLPVAEMEVFGVRRSDFSLKIRAIRPSAVFGTRRKAALRGEGFV